MYQRDTEMLFPVRVAPYLRSLRGPAWRRLVDRATRAQEASIVQLAFCLLMVRVASCLTCHTDSYRAMRGCTTCAIQAVRRFRGDDAELLAHFERALTEVAIHLKAMKQEYRTRSNEGLEVAHEQ